jgi:hypothetical protein
VISASFEYRLYQCTKAADEGTGLAFDIELASNLRVPTAVKNKPASVDAVAVVPP